GIGDQFLENWQEKSSEEPDPDCQERIAEWQRARPLLVAAPRLLSVARRFVKECEHGEKTGEIFFSRLINDARAAIAQATPDDTCP
ncbi:MAG: hypothetical protein LBK99_27370, partial [Opitutaceae bacterium]|nr:hypothetical protein [Opitutaceae bacterium]